MSYELRGGFLRIETFFFSPSLTYLKELPFLHANRVFASVEGFFSCVNMEELTVGFLQSNSERYLYE